jgi:hypothetical protein
MKLILFFGAGVSRPSGLPLVAGLMKQLLTDPYHHQGGGVFCRGTDSAETPDVDGLTGRIRELINLINDYDTSDIKDSGAVYRGNTTTYEDVYYLCQQMSLWNIGLADNSMTTPFLERIETMAGTLLPAGSPKSRVHDLAKLASNACYFIETVVADILCHEYKQGLNLLFELLASPNIEQLNIVTLNHDTLVEQCLCTNGIAFVDGFGLPDGDVRWNDDRLYEAPTARVRLFKLHGSVDWYRFWDAPNRTASVLVKDAAAAKNADGKLLNRQARRPTFLSGINKVTAYQRGIFADVHFRFHQVLRQCSDIVMSGYSWGDTAINFQLDKWMDDSERNRIVLLYNAPEKLIDNSPILGAAWRLRSGTGQIAYISKYFADVSLKELQDLLECPVPTPTESTSGAL